MLLAIDIGNTNTHFGVFDSEKLISHFKVPTVRNKTSDEIIDSIREKISPYVSAIFISSVVPELNDAFQKLSEKYYGLKPVFVDYTFDFNLKIKYNPASALGVDRLIGAFAAIETYGKPCIVCDFGTATTIDAVNSKSEYLGGIIAPGMNVLADALFRKTSKLPLVDIKKPESVFGNSTVSSIQSGIYFGYAGLVDGIIRRMIDNLREKPRIIATGGLASVIAESSELIEMVDETLMLEGLRLIYEKIKH
ncbi:MAG: type III pantothenate kinase [Acidobacteria bacterium]|nr:type III pantothenate kinase [Acidobacteriota bacterium]MCA1637114.1 type III pantothenate kinase [Acidobacteriota bacterium]